MRTDRITHPLKTRARAVRLARRPPAAVERARDRHVPRHEPLDGQAVEAYLARAAVLLQRHRPLLDRLDAAIGDGDHGTALATEFSIALRTLPETPPRDLGGLLRSVGHALMASVEGAGGTLYGAAFVEAGLALGPVARLSPRGIADALDAAARGIARRGRCAVGEKTILDALDPAARAFRTAVEADEPVETAARRAAWAAHAGMRATTPLVARRGLAARLGERSRGHPDPGATSCFLLIRAILPPRGQGRFQVLLPALVSVAG